MKYCDECGQALPNQAKFCGKCGKRQSNYNITITDEKLEDVINVNVDTNITSNTSQKQEASIGNGYDTEVVFTRCPYCLETIVKGAYVCRFCRSDLTGGELLKIKESYKRTDPSIIVHTVADVCFLVLQILIIILSFTDLFSISVILEYGGYQFYNQSIFGLGVFSCFDISDFLHTISNDISLAEADRIAELIRILGFVLILTVIPLIISLIVRIVDISYNYKREGKFKLYEHILVAPVVFVIAIVGVMTFVTKYFDRIDLSIVDFGLSPTAIIIIVLLFIQLIISLVMNITSQYEQESE